MVKGRRVVLEMSVEQGEEKSVGGREYPMWGCLLLGVHSRNALRLVFLLKKTNGQIFLP